MRRALAAAMIAALAVAAPAAARGGEAARGGDGAARGGAAAPGDGAARGGAAAWGGEAPPAGLLRDIAVRYRRAVVSHDVGSAARLRTETRLLADASPRFGRLARVVARTRDVLRPWPTVAEVERLAQGPPAPGGRSYAAIRRALDAVDDATGRRARIVAGLEVAALAARIPGLDVSPLLTALDAGGAPDTDAVRVQLTAAEQALGDVQVSRATVVTDAAIIVFREGLEAVLILAALTASLTRRLRRPVLAGGIAGIGATALTWGLVQLVLEQFGTGGLKLEAITGMTAIVVLLVITNWFFHRVYWSRWIARFNRHRKTVSGALGLALLGLTSVYREGFETVLFVQNLQVSAGTRACVLGASIGLGATLAVGTVTFALQRKLPYRRMLIATGVLITLVLAVMTGTTVHVLQQLAWLPSTPAFTAPAWASSWLGLYGTYEGIAAQLAAPAAVVGSYFAARATRHSARTPPSRVGPVLSDPP